MSWTLLLLTSALAAPPVLPAIPAAPPPGAAMPQPPEPPSPPPGLEPDPIRRELFPPEAIMSQQKALGLSDAQRKKIIAEIQAAQSRMVELQFELQGKQEGLAALLATPRVDEAKVLAQATALMSAEHEMKQTHLRLLVRIKNQLTPEQQVRLRELAPRPPLPPAPPAPPAAPQR